MNSTILRTIAVALTLSLAVLGPGIGADAQEPGFKYGDVVLVPAGDLDEDGKEDAVELLSLSSDTSAVTRLSGVRGTDGTDLWTLEFDGHPEPYALSDLDGGSGADLVLVRYAEDPYLAGQVTTTTLTAIRGEDGEELWTREYAGFATGFDVGSSSGAVQPGYAYPRSTTAGDLDGDRAHDLLISRNSSAYLYESGTGASRESVNRIVEVVSGATGELIAALPVVSLQGYPDADVIPDITGDGLSDVVTMSVALSTQTDGGGTATVSAYQGNSRLPLPIWQSEVDVLSQPFLQTADLDGDDLGDALVISNYHAEEGTSSIEGLTGSDGSSLWSLEFEGYAYAETAGDATGDSGEDLIGENSGFRGGKRSWFLLRGSDGEMLWTRSFTNAGSSIAASDSTGDGVMDILSTVRARGERSRVRIFDGATGKRAWSRVIDEGGHVIPVGGDLDGDGGGDFIVIYYRPGTAAYGPISGQTGRALWSRPATAKGYVNQISVASLRGRPWGDILESWGRGRYLIAGARSGSNGQLLWQRVVELSRG